FAAASVVSFVSPCTSLIFSLWLPFHRFTAVLAQSYWSAPRKATPPVAGYATPILTLVPHLTLAVAADATFGVLAEPHAVVATTSATRCFTSSRAVGWRRSAARSGSSSRGPASSSRAGRPGRSSLPTA